MAGGGPHSRQVLIVPPSRDCLAVCAGVVVDDARLAYEIAVKHGGKSVLEPLVLEEKADGGSLTVAEVRQRERCCSGSWCPLTLLAPCLAPSAASGPLSDQRLARTALSGHIHAGPCRRSMEAGLVHQTHTQTRAAAAVAAVSSATWRDTRQRRCWAVGSPHPHTHTAPPCECCRGHARVSGGDAGERHAVLRSCRRLGKPGLSTALTEGG